MRKQILFLTAAALCGTGLNAQSRPEGTAAAHGFEAYFYTTRDSKPVHSVKDVVSIAFHPEITHVKRVDFTTTPLDNSTFEYMLFRNKTATTSVVAPAAASGVIVSVKGNNLSVESRSDITVIRITALSGVTLVDAAPAIKSFTRDISDLLPGVYLISVFSDNQLSTFRILKK